MTAAGFAIGITFALIFTLGVIAVAIYGYFDKQKGEEGKKILEKIQETKAIQIYIETGCRAGEVVVSIAAMIVTAAQDYLYFLAHSGTGIYIIVLCVFLMLWALVPTWLARILILRMEAEKVPELLVKTDDYRRNQIGSIIFFAGDTTFAFLLAFAAIFGNYSAGIATCVFLLLIMQLLLFLLQYSIFMFRGEEGSAESSTTTVVVTDEPTVNDVTVVDNPISPEVAVVKVEDNQVTMAEAEVVAPPSQEAVTIRIAEFNYTADRDDELSFKEGDRIQVLNERSDGWAKGVCIDSDQDPKPEGMFPLNYTKAE